MSDETREEFEVGDVVRLKSGGPGMTVIKVNPDGDIAVMYYQRSKDFMVGDGYERALIPAVCLEFVTPRPHP